MNRNLTFIKRGDLFLFTYSYQSSCWITCCHPWTLTTVLYPMIEDKSVIGRFLLGYPIGYMSPFRPSLDTRDTYHPSVDVALFFSSCYCIFYKTFDCFVSVGEKQLKVFLSFRLGKMPFYAVRHGKIPGIYKTWLGKIHLSFPLIFFGYFKGRM